MLTEQDLAPYLSKDFQPTGYHGEGVRLARAIAVHAEGKYPAELMDYARPNELPQYKIYRENVFKSPTKKAFNRVVNTFAKIRKAEDWRISFPDSPAAIAEGETLKKYTTVNYPFFDSLENWLFTFALRRLVADPMGVLAIYPLTQTTADNEYRKPFVFTFRSDQVYAYTEGRFAMLLDDKKSVVRTGDNEQPEGNIFHFFDTEDYVYAEQTGKKEDYTYNVTFVKHNGKAGMPCFRLGGQPVEADGENLLYESFIQPCLDDWDEAVRRYSDHQVNMVRHLHPNEWEIENTECRTCNGKGEVQGESVKGMRIGKVSCRSCGGSGSLATRTPFGVKTIKPVQTVGMNQNISIPMPPMGVVERDIASISFLKDEYQDKIREGLEALNLEFLSETPLNQSGRAKEFDRDEMNTFFHQVAAHLVKNILYPCFWYISTWRYGGLLSEKELDEIQPAIPIPDKFDLITSSVLAERAANAKKNNFSPTLVSSLEKSYAANAFGEDSQDYLFFSLVVKLDPLGGLSSDEKLSTYDGKGCTQRDFIVSSNIQAFVRRAMEENEQFPTLKLKDQMALLYAYAAEVTGTMNGGLVPMFGPDGQPMDTPQDVEAEAKAKLKGTVGGVQGILGIQASVAQGITDYGAAIALLYEIYGFDDATARAVLGTPKTITPSPANDPATAGITQPA